MVQITITGTFAVAQNVARAADLLNEVGAQTVKGTCLRIAYMARSLAPVATGELKRSIAWKANKTRGYVGITAGSPANVYWRFPEFGTIHASAHPYFRPAKEAAAGPMLAEMKTYATKVGR